MTSPPPATPRAVALRTLAVMTVFGFYAATVALAPPDERPSADTTTPYTTSLHPTSPVSPQTWRAAGCHFCHSLYGLGGHTGPDLTNVVSRSSTDYVRVVVQFGRPGMPAYPSIEPAELDAILAYLSEVDRAATYPPRGLIEGALGAR